MSENRDIWVLLEAEDGRISRASAALLAEGERVASEMEGEVHALFLGPAIDGIAREVGVRGGGTLLQCIDERLRQYDPFRYEQVLLDLLSDRKPYLLLALASSLGADLLPRLAFKLGAPLVTHCAEIEIQDGEVQFLKSVQKGRLFAGVRAKGEGVRMATFLPERLVAGTGGEERGAAEVVRLNPPPAETEGLVRVTGFRKADHRTIDITEAEVVIAIGRGLAAESLAAVEAFADRIGGAIGGTRPMVDAGILPYERQIGQTGKRVSPKLIFLLGISGATEFIQGVVDAGTSVAINIDRQSPIFRSVDLGIAGDLNELMPGILKHIGASAGSGQANQGNGRPCK